MSQYSQDLYWNLRAIRQIRIFKTGVFWYTASLKTIYICVTRMLKDSPLFLLFRWATFEWIFFTVSTLICGLSKNLHHLLDHPQHYVQYDQRINEHIWDINLFMYNIFYIFIFYWIFNKDFILLMPQRGQIYWEICM